MNVLDFNRFKILWSWFQKCFTAFLSKKCTLAQKREETLSLITRPYVVFLNVFRSLISFTELEGDLICGDMFFFSNILLPQTIQLAT